MLIPYNTGNGNGNKMNLRIEILENLLKASGDGTSAKVNSLRQAVKRNKTDVADNTAKSLDLLRLVFQDEMTDEIKQIIDRHLRTSFAPAFENLKRNGLEVTEADMNALCIAILDGAKESFLPHQPTPPNVCIPSGSLIKNMPEPAGHNDRKGVNESDDYESDGSMMSQASSGTYSASNPMGVNRPKKRGRPRKVDIDTGRSGTPVMNGMHPVSASDAAKWNPDRITKETRFILGSKVNKLLQLGHRGHIFMKYPRMFRYVGDDEDKAWLFEKQYSTRMSGKVFFLTLEDAVELAHTENIPHVIHDLQRYSFLIPDHIASKIKARMAVPFEQLKARVSVPPPPAQMFPPNPFAGFVQPSPSG
ncbi:AT hook domain-containing protein family protein [Aphelenchoides avenae]|nr:AT hook domain-containing protein family protein [Aphelenchus avenae]